MTPEKKSKPFLLSLFNELYLSSRIFIILVAIILLFTLSFSLKVLFAVAQILFFVFLILIVLDVILLFTGKGGLQAGRECREKLSNGDENTVFLYLKNSYSFKVSLQIIDELPIQFQSRDFLIEENLLPGQQKKISYLLFPKERGEYLFGALNIFVRTPLFLVSRRFRFDAGKVIKVYPSYIQMRKFELMAISDRLSDYGIKKIRKLGHNMEFEQVKEYIQGDDIRTINWKATARKAHLMVNTYQDERSQQVYSVIDKGRLMQSPFEKMTLLDYAINACLVISNIAILKQDKAGIFTYNEVCDSYLLADRKSEQKQHILDFLYNQQTFFRESNVRNFYIQFKKRVKQRSLVLLYTNFNSLNGLERQLPYLKRLAFHHLLVVIFFENVEIKMMLEQKAADVEEIYRQAIAEKFISDKRQIVKELRRYGIHALLTSPHQLTVDTINTYLEFKSRGMI